MNKLDQLKNLALTLQAVESQTLQRFQAELEFCEGLALLEGKEKAWAKMIDQAFNLVAQAAKAPQPGAAINLAVAEAEKVLAPIGKVAKTYTIHCVGHAHIDMNWMWSWPETVHTTNDTFATMLRLMDEFPEFTFSQSQASTYELIRQHNPEMFKKIAQRIKEGRWEVVGSHWVEGDKNCVSGESLARHLLYTRAFMKEHFDLDPEDVLIDFSPDTFGHAYTIPSIDARGGVRRYYLCRGGVRWPKPPVFYFQGPDGSRVLVYYETTWYSDTLGPHNIRGLMNFASKTGMKDWMNMYGVGDHGGGPTRRDLACMAEMDTWPIFPNFRFGTTHKYFELLEKKGNWPVLDRELNFECDGCYTSQSEIKKNNRLGEIFGVEAEWAGVLGQRLAGIKYPEETLRNVWQEVLFTHFHDILPGSGVPATRQFNQGTFQRVAATTSMIRTSAYRAIAAKVKTDLVEPAAPPATAEQESISMGAGVGHRTAEGGISAASAIATLPGPFVVFNQLAQHRTEVVQATLWDPQCGPGERQYMVRAADGREIPAQTLEQGHKWNHRYVEVAFPAQVGPLGYAASVVTDAGEVYVRPPTSYNYNYECLDAPVKPQGQIEAPVVQTPQPNPNWTTMPAPEEYFTMENDHLRVAFDLKTGGIKTLLDKATGQNLADPANPLGVLEYAIERPGGMTAWVTYEAYTRVNASVTSVTKSALGPYVVSIIVKARAGSSEVTVTYSLKAGQRWLDIDVATRWMEVGSPAVGVPKLLMKFPLALKNAKGRYEIPFGSIERQENAGQEVPALRWADVNGQGVGKNAPAGCTLLNDSKNGHSLDGSTLRLTLLRSSHDPDPLPEIGDHTMRLALVPHGKAPTVAELMQLGAAFNQPLQVVATDLHAGTLPAAAEALTLEAGNAVISSIKQALDGQGLIVRLLETEGRAGQAKIKLNARLLGKIKQAAEVDLLERPVAKSGATLSAGGLSVKLSPHAVVSVRIVVE